MNKKFDKAFLVDKFQVDNAMLRYIYPHYKISLSTVISPVEHQNI